MRLLHLLNSHDISTPTGVPRFSGYFRRAFPECFNVTPGTVGALEWSDDDVCVTDNSLALLVPDCVKTIVTHHGCAPYHFKVDAAWRNETTQRLMIDQLAMLNKPRLRYVAPSAWVRDRFSEIAPPFYRAEIIPHFVELNESKKSPRIRRGERIIGDWRTPNKGSGVIDAIKDACPEYEFRQLDFPAGDDAARQAFYSNADAYLCLSLSEGAPYSVADAEAAGLPIISTEVGNVYEFVKDRPLRLPIEIEQVKTLLCDVRTYGRTRTSFYSTYSFDDWKAAWSRVIYK